MSPNIKEEEFLKDEERQPCEIWTRVMGYHRPLALFNIGKKGEHQERCFFKEHPHGSCCRNHPIHHD